MTIRYMCTANPHEREFLTPPPRTPTCCGKPMKRMTEDAEEAPGDDHDPEETTDPTASG